jgi:hypothetical protein
MSVSSDTLCNDHPSFTLYLCVCVFMHTLQSSTNDRFIAGIFLVALKLPQISIIWLPREHPSGRYHMSTRKKLSYRVSTSTALFSPIRKKLIHLRLLFGFWKNHSIFLIFKLFTIYFNALSLL